MDGIPGAEALAAQKRLAALISYKLKREYSEMCGFVRARISIEIVRSNSLLLRSGYSVHILDHRSKSPSTLQASLKATVIIFLLCLCKIIFWGHAQVRACIEVDNFNVNHRGVLLLPEAVGAYICPRLCRYYYLSRLPY